jgi:hypothetical protein
MSCSTPVIGATPEDEINYGESIELILTYKDAEGAPIDLTTATASVFESAPPVIKAEAVVSILDAEAGQIRLFLDRTNALSLRKGKNNWFRLQVIFGAESDDVTPQIYFQVT